MAYAMKLRVLYCHIMSVEILMQSTCIYLKQLFVHLHGPISPTYILKQGEARNS